MKINPTTFVIFGATGDLFRKKLAPASWRLFQGGLLPQVFRVVAFSRRPWDDAEFRDFFKEVFGAAAGAAPPKHLSDFLSRVFYVEGDLNTSAGYEKMAERLGEFDTEVGVCMNKLFYLATPPSSYETILRHISLSGLAIPCDPTKDGGEPGWTRILVEKPFGSNANEADSIDRLLAELFSENQIFRIDHYLTKEVLRDIITFRFADGIFEQVWNGKHIREVSVQLLEKGDASGRGAFYDALGALRDVGQNHALQMAALVAMEKPESIAGEAVRRSRASPLQSFVCTKSFRAQYEGYKKEKGVAPGSTTDTYFKLELALGSPRWQGVPFILESGKCLPESRAEITVTFKKPEKFAMNGVINAAQSIHFKIQPEEEITILTKEGKRIPFVSAKSGKKKTDAYEQVLLDAVLGDQTRFTSTEEVQAEWRIITPILDSWRNLPLTQYCCNTMPKSPF
ncbi:glucose-6-phosphate dehydrogenase (NADP(+)) [Patescibacteria group bacterium]|nr:glucose-6-phosphate dehydrogenase (NADP(+)) [Patescibacteria group bacterium]